MENLWKFSNGVVSGVVIGESEEEAAERANQYLSIQFDDIPEAVVKPTVWKVVDDEEFTADCPYVVAVSVKICK